MKNCLSNVAEIARNHDIFGPIDERILDRVQVVSDFYTAFPGNIGKPRNSVENTSTFTLLSSGKPCAVPAESFIRPSRQPWPRPSFSGLLGVVNGASPSYRTCDERKAFALVRFSTMTNPLVLNGPCPQARPRFPV
ncbi:hypothetical protein G6L16_002115 [Agrobacterium tumefaciens]|uniref:hypothetical protein n=1 Tax=Rhizobium/Agrobacterium group TaxID=227290 RepID=UPI001573B38B|nr:MULTISPECIES: hypothetical protein [Rhizobium/Agrobacterium group]MDH7806435.1 hypothetical protein [Rhizobium sp. AN67]NSZ62127.1 hypothetical protein [Agrobacterium tumefaciens]NTA68499.1 hypothetical protein [Agrobacterium tumefaciens]WIE38331.1 hypothetical protein G6L16_002115 [Agrobacterium tumefaciens]